MFSIALSSRVLVLFLTWCLLQSLIKAFLHVFKFLIFTHGKKRLQVVLALILKLCSVAEEVVSAKTNASGKLHSEVGNVVAAVLLFFRPRTTYTSTRNSLCLHLFQSSCASLPQVLQPRKRYCREVLLIVVLIVLLIEVPEQLGPQLPAYWRWAFRFVHAQMVSGFFSAMRV